MDDSQDIKRPEGTPPVPDQPRSPRRRERPLQAPVQVSPQAVQQAWGRIVHAVEEFPCTARERRELEEAMRLTSQLLQQALVAPPVADPPAGNDEEGDQASG